MNRDFAEMLNALADESARYLVVGAYAVAGHGIPRATQMWSLAHFSSPFSFFAISPSACGR